MNIFRASNAVKIKKKKGNTFFSKKERLKLRCKKI